MSEQKADADKLKTATHSEREFSAISPLEPLDPNKFRNIMLDKEAQNPCEMDIGQQQQTKQEPIGMASSSTFATEVQRAIPHGVAGQQKIIYKALPPPHAHNQPHIPYAQNPQQVPQSPVYPPGMQQQQHLQHLHSLPQSQQQQPQQYFTTQAQPAMQIASPQYPPMYTYSGMPMPSQQCAGVASALPATHPMQQPAPQAYMVQQQPGSQQQQWVIQQQQMPQVYHNPPQQTRIYPSQQPQHSVTIKQMSQTTAGCPNMVESPVPHPHMMPYSQQPAAHEMQRQISQEFNYQQMPVAQSHQLQQQQHVVSQPAAGGGFVSYGYVMDARQQQEMACQHNAQLQSPTNIKRPHPQMVAEQVHHPQHMGGQIEHVRNHSAPGFSGQKPQMQRMPVSSMHQQQQQQPPQFFGQQITTTMLDREICLAGCVFLIIEDFSAHLVDSTSLTNVIRFYGGDIESSNPRGIPERVTNIICSSWLENEALIQQAVANTFVDRMPRKMKRIVTVNWLNDTIEKRKVEPPTKACHLPGYWNVLKQNPQISTKIISIAGFDKRDCASLKYMIHATGARFSALNAKTDYLVVNKSSMIDEETQQKAQQFQVKTVNYKWLLELYFGNLNVFTMAETARYFPDNEGNLLSGVTTSPHYLLKISDPCQKLMLPWMQPILVTEEAIKAAYESKATVTNDKNVFPEKSITILDLDNAPNEEQIKKAAALVTVVSGKQKIAIIIEVLMPEQCENLAKKVRFLGGKEAERIEDCTHFVTANLRKSVHLLIAVAMGKHVVTPLWIEACFKRLQFVDPLDFFVKDRENERKLGFSLKTTILRARHRRVFQDIKFHISQGVQPSVGTVKRLVEAAGGIVEMGKPKKRDLLHCIQNNQTYFVVCSRDDLPFYQYLVNCNFPLFNEDFIMMSILRHKINLANEFHAYPSIAIAHSHCTK